MAEGVTLTEKRKRRRPAKLLSETEQISPKVAKFYVVEFPAEKKTSVVPENWLEYYEGQHFSFWPPPELVRSALREAIRNGQTPDPDKWSSYPVRIHFSDSYENCVKMENGLTLPSTSGGSSDEQLTSKSARKKKKKSPNPENDDSQVIPEAGMTDAAITDGNMTQEEQLAGYCQMCICAVNCPHCKAKDKANKRFQRAVLESLAKLTIEVQASAEAHKTGVKPFRPDGTEIPLRSLDDMLKLEALLTNPVVVQDLKAALKSHVDAKLYNTALAMMKSIFTIRLMRQLNWEGKGTLAGKTGLVKRAPKLAAAILNGAKEAVGDRWPLADIKLKLMRILVKAPLMTDDGTDEPAEPDEPVPEANAIVDNVDEVAAAPINVNNDTPNNDV